MLMMLMLMLIARDGSAAVSKLDAREWKLLLDRQTAVAGSNGLFFLFASFVLCHFVPATWFQLTRQRPNRDSQRRPCWDDGRVYFEGGDILTVHR